MVLFCLILKQKSKTQSAIKNSNLKTIRTDRYAKVRWSAHIYLHGIWQRQAVWTIDRYVFDKVREKNQETKGPCNPEQFFVRLNRGAKKVN